MKEHEVKIPHKVEIETRYPAFVKIRLRLDGGDWTDWHDLKREMSIIVENEVPIKWIDR